MATLTAWKSDDPTAASETSARLDEAALRAASGDEG
jgi:hypothetical protein